MHFDASHGFKNILNILSPQKCTVINIVKEYIFVSIRVKAKNSNDIYILVMLMPIRKMIDAVKRWNRERKEAVEANRMITDRHFTKKGYNKGYDDNLSSTIRRLLVFRKRAGIGLTQVELVKMIIDTIDACEKVSERYKFDAKDFIHGILFDALHGDIVAGTKRVKELPQVLQKIKTLSETGQNPQNYTSP